MQYWMGDFKNLDESALGLCFLRCTISNKNTGVLAKEILQTSFNGSNWQATSCSAISLSDAMFETKLITWNAVCWVILLSRKFPFFSNSSVAQHSTQASIRKLLDNETLFRTNPKLQRFVEFAKLDMKKNVGNESWWSWLTFRTIFCSTLELGWNF